jgi:dephospho-CoA kinase
MGEGLRSPNAITLVCGPPGSGKTTYVNNRRKPGDLVWDLDSIMHAITGEEIHHTPASAVHFATAMRTAFFSEAKKPLGHRIWIIDACPTISERTLFKQALNAEIVLLNTPEQVCIERVRERGPGWPALVSKWFRISEQWFDRTLRLEGARQ